MSEQTNAQKPLTARQAASCENAKSPRSSCKCRCGGAHHGAGRGSVRGLEAGDPHRPDDEDPKARRKRERDEAQRRKWEMLEAMNRGEPSR